RLDQIDADPCCRILVACDVEPDAPYQGVGPRATIQRVISITYIKGVVSVTSEERVDASAFNKPVSVAATKDVVAIAAKEQIVPALAVQHIIAVVTLKMVLAPSTPNDIVPPPAGNVVIAGEAVHGFCRIRAGERVAIIGKDKCFDANESMSSRCAAVSRLVNQVDISVCAGVILDRVKSGVAGQQSEATDWRPKNVIAGAAFKY